ncbi:MAG: ATP-grasp domain-containing protein [Thermoleophilaceae bacterium]
MAAAPLLACNLAALIRVLLTGTEHAGGLAALRALRAAGFGPWAAVTSADDDFGARSRAASGVIRAPDARLDPSGFAHAVAEGAARVSARVVLPGTESALLTLAARRELFAPDVAVGVCSRSVTAAATDKVVALAVAARAGIDVLACPVLGAEDPVDTAGVRFPAAVKPLRSELPVDGELRRFDATRADDRAELLRALAALPDGVGIVQPYVEGHLVTVDGVAWEGAVVASIQKVGTRTWPTDCGPVSYAKTIPPDPELAEQARALIARLGWSGVFNLQFIEGREGRFLIDVNPRFYTSLGLAVAAGVNLPAIWVEALLGGRPKSPRYRPGVRFRSEDDLRSLAHALVAGGRRSALAGLVPRRRTTHAVVSLRDPRPSLVLLRRGARWASRRRRARPQAGAPSRAKP